MEHQTGRFGSEYSLCIDKNILLLSGVEKAAFRAHVQSDCRRVFCTVICRKIEGKPLITE
jgi:hypothetical protein